MNRMGIGKDFLAELQLEAAVSRRFLEAVPFDQLDFQPHEKSEKLGRLAVHVAEIMAWFSSCIRDKQLDFEHFVPNTFDNKDALLSYFDGLLKEASELLLSASDAVFEEVWSMTYGEEVLFALPKKQVMRIFCTNHLVHHRAQLGLYLRLLNVPVPATYGPSADDEQVILIHTFNPL
jgi:uncharacterized damage-inducible protein DinB